MSYSGRDFWTQDIKRWRDLQAGPPARQRAAVLSVIRVFAARASKVARAVYASAHRFFTERLHE